MNPHKYLKYKYILCMESTACQNLAIAMLTRRVTD
jgi:hypothetical protein